MIKIMFLCGSLEPGQDGVGDYTCRLAGELIRQGYEVAIIALHDPLVDEREKSVGIQQDGDHRISTLRLSTRLPWSDRVHQANAFVDAIDPSWISIQYVPFSFHSKGLHIGLGNLLKRICIGRKIQVMFHELWVGMYTQAPTYYVWWGQLQRYLIQLLITTLKPNLVHTHTPLYQVQLGKLGVKASMLPLFTNIPLAEGTPLRMAQPISKASSNLKFIFFGGIHPGSPAEQLATEVAAYARQKKINVELTIIGRSGPQQEVWATVWRANGLTVHVLGETSPAKISEALSHSSMGLSTTPVTLSGKSGAIAAMHAHGLPVLCVSTPWQPRNVSSLQATPGVLEYTAGNFNDIMNSQKTIHIPSININDVTQQLVKDLLLTNE